jgi:hypothetical protein
MDNQFAYDSAKLEQAIRAGAGPQLIQWLAGKGVRFAESLGPQRVMTAQMAMDAMAMDAPQSALETSASAGIPWFFANWVDPKIIPILLSPMMGAVIAGEVQKGDWLTETAMFLTAGNVGESSAYGDYNESGSTNVNVNFPQRQNFVFQAFLQYGEREVGRAGLAKLDWISLQQQSNAMRLMKDLNEMYFFGISNLVNYGILNDPSLPPALTATYPWLTSSSATANTMYQDVVRMFVQLQSQSGGVVRQDTRMVLAMSPTQAMALSNITQYNTNSVLMLLKQNYPNLRLETAVEYGPPNNSSGQLMQLIAEDVEGQRTLEGAFSSKLMAHQMVVGSSSWRQKRSSSGFGTVIYRPFLIAQMYG